MSNKKVFRKRKEMEERKQLSKTISDKIETVAKLRSDLEKKKTTAGNSVDEQIIIAEMEYRLVKEEMALLSYQEKHWESAALWDVPPPLLPTKGTENEMWDVLNSYIMSLKEKGWVPALHTTQQAQLQNSILVSCKGEGGAPIIPRVEWAHQTTELQTGDRLVEVNGHLVIGKDSTEVSHILTSTDSVCRVVFLRPQQQTVKGKETSNLRQELTTVVTRLNHKMVESSRLTEENLKLQKENDDLKMQSRKLKLQLVSLQSILLYMLQMAPSSSPLPPVFDLLRNNGNAPDEGVVCLLPRISKWRMPSLPMKTPEEQNNSPDLVTKSDS